MNDRPRLESGARCLLAAALLASFAFLQAMAASADPEQLWHEKVRPILNEHCFRCHGGVYQKADLDLRSLATMLRGGENGPAIQPGRVEASPIWQFVQPGADPHMPPGGKKQLSEDEIQILKEWLAALPETPLCQATNQEERTQWVQDYLKTIEASKKPDWEPPAGMAPHRVISRFVQRRWKELGVKPSPGCDDLAFVRRVYLDLAGRIPAREEVEAFLQDHRSQPRARLVDHLLASADYPRHLREIFDVVLMQRRGTRFEEERRDHHWFKFLEDSFRDNRPWNQIVRDLIVARPESEIDRGALWFLYERRNNYQAMAEAVGPLAYGMQIGCAQCHNHALAWEVEQRHYWGLVAAFNRSTNVTTEAGIGIAESAIGGHIRFANLKKESQPALLAFLNGKSVEEPLPAEGEKEADAPELYRVPPPQEKEKAARPSVPIFSRRAALADAVTQDNPWLARAFVNRIWAMLMGRGLVHPVDEMDSRHPPTHPDLLNWLARDFEAHGYDIQRLIRAIVLSRPYQLDSRAPRAAWRRQEGPETIQPSQSLHRALEKPLSAEQLFRSWLIATGHSVDTEGKVAGISAAELRRAIIERFPDLFASEHSASWQQAMFVSNSPLLDHLLKPRPGNAASRILALRELDERVREAFVTIYGRQPGPEEMAQSIAFLSKKTPEAGVQQLMWALLSSAEFLINH